MPLRICMVTTFYPPNHFGGDGIFVYRLSQALAKQGHHVEVIHCVDAYNMLAQTKSSAQYENHPNVTVHALRSRFGVMSPLVTQQLGSPGLKHREIKRILDDGDFDVIHYHNISLVGGPRVLAYGNAIKLYTLHEYWLICPTHVLFKYDKTACEKPNCTVCTLSYQRPPQLWRYTSLVEKSVSHVDAFIASCQFTADIHKERGLDIPISVIPMCIPELTDGGSVPDGDSNGSDKFSPPADTKPSRPFFLFVGRLEKLKGLQDVIPIFEQFPNVDLIVVGSGKYENTLKNLACGMENVSFLGQLETSALVALYRDAVSLVVPSLCYETFGLILLESFSLKTPVIGRNIGAIGELVRTSQAGLLFDSPTEFADAIRFMLTEEDARSEMSHRGYAYYEQHGRMEQYLEKYLSLISHYEIS